MSNRVHAVLEGVAPVKSAARALDLLDDLAENGPATQLQLSTRLGIPKSSLHSILRTMTGRGWLETDPTGTVYRLGIRSLITSSAYLDADLSMSRCRPILDELAELTGETVHLGRLDGPFVVYTAKRESPHPLRMYSAVGRRLPACSTALGRALLAELPPAERDGLIPDSPLAMTERTTTDRNRILDLVEQVSQDGYAVESDESCLGLRCFGVALPLTRPVADAISVSVPISRLDPEREELIIGRLLDVKHRLAASLPAMTH